MTDREKRELGPEMRAEGWTVVGGDWLLWLHEPSHRSVNVDGPIRRSACSMPCFGDEPVDRETDGYVVACSYRDEHGNPIAGDAFWTASYATAIRKARQIRAAILAEKPAPVSVDQLTLDDVLGRGDGQ